MLTTVSHTTVNIAAEILKKRRNLVIPRQICSKESPLDLGYYLAVWLTGKHRLPDRQRVRLRLIFLLWARDVFLIHVIC